MLRIETEADIERLRQMARLLAKENDLLHRRLAQLSAELASARGQQATQIEMELTLLKEQLDRHNRQMFGPSSEKRRPEAADPADDPSPADRPAESAKPDRRGHGPTAQPRLPIVEQVHVLDEPDKVCPQCGGPLVAMEGQFEPSEQIDVVERQFRVVRHLRQKYRCRCNGCIETALAPPKVIEGGRYSVDFVVAVAIDKYADHLPLARQQRRMARCGLTVDRQTLWDQLWAGSRHLLATYQALPNYLYRKAVLGADETTWPVSEGQGPPSKWWVWALTGDDAVYYRIIEDRNRWAAAQLLETYTGVVLVDGHGAYTALQAELQRRVQQPELLEPSGPAPPVAVFCLAYCWAHVRRKFVECEGHYPKAAEVLDLIGKLYQVEREARQTADGDRLAVLARLRREKSAPILAQIHDWLTTTPALPRSGLGAAIHYALKRWQGLVRFVDDPRIALDNNASERQMRAPVVGRKNHYGSRSLRGTEVAALFYSLIESAKLAGLEPADYLRQALLRAIANPGTVTLPADLLAERQTVTS